MESIEKEIMMLVLEKGLIALTGTTIYVFLMLSWIRWCSAPEPEWEEPQNEGRPQG